MRVLFTTWNSPSHLFPMVPLMWAFQAAGHQVRVAGPPSCEKWVAGAGMTAVTVGKDLDMGGELTQNAIVPLNQQPRWPSDWMVRPDDLDERQHAMLVRLADKNFAVADAMLDDLVEFARDWRPDLVVYDTTCYAGAVVAAVLDVPAYSHMWGTGAPVRNEMSRLGDVPLPGFAALFERFGVAPRPNPVAWLDPAPPGMQLPTPGTRIDLRFVPYNGGGEVPRWLLRPAARPRVCLSWGVVTNRVTGEVASAELRLVLDAVAGLDADVVLAAAHVPDDFAAVLPDNVRAVESVPLNAWLPGCDAIVHHGGGGTTLVATWAGIPQLIISGRPVYALTGDRVSAAGAGVHRGHDEIAAVDDRVGLLRSDIAALLTTPAYGAAARELAAQIRARPALDETVRKLTVG